MRCKKSAGVDGVEGGEKRGLTLPLTRRRQRGGEQTARAHAQRVGAFQSKWTIIIS